MDLKYYMKHIVANRALAEKRFGTFSLCFFISVLVVLFISFASLCGFWRKIYQVSRENGVIVYNL